MLVASTSVFGFNCTAPAASSSRTPPSRPSASARWRASATGLIASQRIRTRGGYAWRCIARPPQVAMPLRRRAA